MSSQAELNAAPAVSSSGFATGDVRTILRLEGLAVLVVALALAYQMHLSWLAFALFFLAPDLSMLAYLAGPRAGAIAYNFAHTYALALALLLAGSFTGLAAVTGAATIWLAHIGADRALGYGLKYPTRFGDTHLGRIGRG